MDETTEIEFRCPRCGSRAFYYPLSGMAGCVIHGWLLYTEIPQELKETPAPPKETKGDNHV